MLRAVGAAAAAGLEVFVQLGAQGEEGGGEAEDDAGGEGDAEGKQQHAGVEVHFVEAGNVAGNEEGDGARGEGGKERPQRAADQRQGKALGEQLGEEAGGSGTERDADGDFLLPSSGAGQQEVGDVGGGNQEDEEDGGEKSEQ